MIEESQEVIQTLINLGTKFDTGEGGDYDYTREGAHRRNRILHHKDETGKEITDALLRIAIMRKNITFITRTTMIDLIEKDNTCYGIVCEDEFGEKGRYPGKGYHSCNRRNRRAFQEFHQFPPHYGRRFCTGAQAQY
jgi:L-aspartate oxidase